MGHVMCDACVTCPCRQRHGGWVGMCGWAGSRGGIAEQQCGLVGCRGLGMWRVGGRVEGG